MPERRARFRESLADAPPGRKLMGELYHFEHRLDPRLAKVHEQHAKHDDHVDEVYGLLVDERAPSTCFVIAHTELDGQETPLREAVEELMRTGAGFVSCIPGRLVSTSARTARTCSS